jgi:lysine 6-dehydrogenase
MNYLILGAGKMARGLVHYLLGRDRAAHIRVLDRVPAHAKELVAWSASPRVSGAALDFANRPGVRRELERADVALSAAHYRFNAMLTTEAIRAKTHLVDLGGNNDIVARQLSQHRAAERAGVTVIPDTGLAPGLASLLAMWAIEGMDRAVRVRIRVGGVPLEPQPPLGYALVFSAEGLINEYVEDALVLRAGKLVRVPSLTEVEPIRFQAPFGLMEAAHTSGGASTLVSTLRGRVRTLEYKTIRYPGHFAQVRALKELGFFATQPVEVGRVRVSPRELTGLLVERSLPTNAPDAILVRVTAEGEIRGRRQLVNITLVDRFDRRTGLSAMARCTAFPSACIAWMIAHGAVAKPGVHCQENVVPVRPLIAELRRAGLRIQRRATAG